MTEPSKRPKGLADTLIKGLLERVALAGQSLQTLEQAAGISISLGVSREQFVAFVGELAGSLYDAAASRRAPPSEPPPADGADG